MNNTFRIINANAITPYRIIENAEVIVQNGIISHISSTITPSFSGETLDANGLYLSPGFIDIHTHGCGGHDFMDADKEGYLAASKMYASHGATTVLPTTLACKKEELINVIKLFDEIKGSEQGARFYGLHFEGPYFSKNQRGAQDERYITPPVKEDYDELLGMTNSIVRWTAAPELCGIAEFGAALRSHGVLPSIGHTDAVYEDVIEAFENGFTHITHLYSGMSAMVRKNSFRYPGVTESAYMIDEMTVEIIADGRHLPPSILKYVYKAKGPERVCLITDSMRAAGMPDGKSILGSVKDGQEVVVEDGVAKLLDRSAFAGSVATAELLVRNMIKLADVPLCDAVRMITSTPARIAGIKNKGKLAVSYDADFVLFDSDINIAATFVDGREVYKK